MWWCFHVETNVIRVMVSHLNYTQETGSDVAHRIVAFKRDTNKHLEKPKLFVLNLCHTPFEKFPSVRARQKGDKLS